MTTIGYRRAFASITAVTLMLLTSCSSDPDPGVGPTSTAEDSQPPGMDVTFRWIASPDFDLLSPSGTIIRAFVESYELARDGRDTAWAYPGFVNSSPLHIEQMIDFDGMSFSFSGSFFYRVLSHHDEGSLSYYTLCRYGYFSTQDSRSSPGGRDSDWWDPRPITLTVNKADTPPPDVQRGPRRAPVVDVFGDWKVVEFDFAPRDPDVGDTPEYARCAADLSGIPAVDTDKDSPPLPLPPSPGWPGAGL